MKFTVNGNEIEMERDFVIYYEDTDNYYYVAVITLADYTVKVLMEDLGLALSNIDSIDKFKEFVDTYGSILEKIKAKEKLLDQELELDSYIEHMESIEEEEEEEYFVGKGFYRGFGRNRKK